MEHDSEKFPEMTTFLRGDSGFAVPGLYDLYERESVYYVIRLKSNAALQRIADELHPASVPADASKTAVYVETIDRIPGKVLEQDEKSSDPIGVSCR